MGGGGQDFDGVITEFAWDFDGDGIYDFTSPSAITGSNYTNPGLFNAKLRGTDDQGAWDVDTVAVLVMADDGTGTWTSASPRPVDGALVGEYSSMAIVAGRPAMSYVDDDTNQLKFVRAADATGATWQAPVFVEDVAGSVETYTSLVVVNGNPAITWFDTLNLHLRYIRATDPQGSAWGPRVDVDINPTVGMFCSMAIVSGNPAIAYRDGGNGNGDLKFARATTVDGSGSWTTMTVDADPIQDRGNGASLSIIEGKPAIAYLDVTSNSLYYVRAANAVGTIWGTPDSPSAFGAGGWASLLEVDGLPAVAYEDMTDGSLIFARCFNLDGGIGWPVMTLDSLGTVTGEYNSLALINGNPAVAYLSDGGMVRYMRAKSIDGSVWGPSSSVAAYMNTSPITLLSVGGKPAVGFMEVDLHLVTGNLGYWREN